MLAQITVPPRYSYIQTSLNLLNTKLAPGTLWRPELAATLELKNSAKKDQNSKVNDRLGYGIAIAHFHMMPHPH